MPKVEKKKKPPARAVPIYDKNKKPPAKTVSDPQRSPAWPIADKALSQKILDLISQGKEKGIIKKGANEVTKSLNHGVAMLVILAADTEPIEILSHLPVIAEDKDCPYIYVETRLELGRACGIPRNVIAASITSGGGEDADNMRKQVAEIVAKVESQSI